MQLQVFDLQKDQEGRSNQVLLSDPLDPLKTRLFFHLTSLINDNLT